MFVIAAIMSHLILTPMILDNLGAMMMKVKIRPVRFVFLLLS